MKIKLMTSTSRTTAVRRLLTTAFVGVLSVGAAKADTLRVIEGSALKIVDPIVTTSGDTQIHGYLIYDKLFEFDSSGTPHPQMADKVDVDSDKKTYTITLRKGLKFSDGAPITTDDVIQSLKRWESRDVVGGLLGSRTKEMVKVDDLTFRIELNEPFDVPSALASTEGNVPFIMPKRVASLPPTEQLTDTTGSGPYKFDYSTWKPGQTPVYTKNSFYTPRNDPPSFYWGKKEATFDKIEVSYIPDPNTAMAAMLTGKQDIWLTPAIDNALALRKDPKLVVSKGYFVQSLFVVNHEVPPFNNIKATEALTYLIDQREVMQISVGDPQFWHPCYAYLTCEGKYGDESAYSGHRGAADFDKAKELFREAGYDGKPIVIFDLTDWAEAHARSLYLAQQLRKIGVQVDLQAMDWATVTSRRTSKAPASEGGWNLFPTYMEVGPASSPITHLMLAANCDKAWFGWPCDEKLEKLRAAFASAVDENEKKKITFELQARASAYFPFVMTGEYGVPIVYGADIEGFNPEAPYAYFWNIRRKAK
ncbi:ABC transporter substrate-binding protein [Mesorhizobium sp. C280B]|uniref:ABC transporter substrate-binding protein n=1 Tax=unclassified Mesorhizobium TaxID=325217 RepID=UPI0003CE1E63|nr:ABC transporter substrate-binding protein [Mesorhizobium sp. LSJC280B00]ESW77370.1 peptide ABC transporter substrate-binding protein [Mesorhizobium sp. LSJC280B00]